MPYITYSRCRDNYEKLKACALISEFFANSSVARRGRKSIRGVIKAALLRGYQKIILVAGKGGDLHASIIKTKRLGQDYTWHSTYYISFKPNKLYISEGDSGDAKERFVKEAED